METLNVEKIPFKGQIKIELFDSEGNLKFSHIQKNTFMTVGKNHVADQLGQAAGAEVKMGWMAIGTSGTAKAAANTTLNKQLDRNALSAGYPEQGATAPATVVYKCAWAAGDGTGALQEAGVFNSSGAGTMLCAATFPVINKGASDTLTITWVVTCG
jgi:hypothetical protein